MTFLGKPDSIDENALEADLQDFVVKRKNAEGEGFTVALNPSLISEEAKASLRKYGIDRPTPWQFDAKRKAIYCGLHRHYYHDAEIYKEVRAGKHGVFEYE